MQMIAFLTVQLSIRRILDHLGLSTPPQDKPPPVREILRGAEHDEGWGVARRPTSGAGAEGSAYQQPPGLNGPRAPSKPPSEGPSRLP